MDFFVDTFNNRELATFVWVLIVTVAFSFSSQTRSSFVIVIKTLFQKYVLMPFLLMFSYVSLQVFILYKAMLWDFSLLKDTIYWILGVALLQLVNINQASKNSLYFKSLVLWNLKLIIIIEFIVNLYAFNFLAEIFIFPIVALFVLIATITENKSELGVVNKMANVMLGVFGFIVLMFSLVQIADDFRNFWVLDNLKDFLLPILLGITFIPFLYLTALYMGYELLFVRLGIFSDRDVVKYAKKRIWLLCNVKLSRLNEFIRENTNKLTRFNDKAGIDMIVRDFKKDKPIY